MPPESTSQFSRFETELRVRPDDIDMNRHVHNSHYLDYVLAARYDQMERCYGMSMEEFIKQGFGWVVRTAHVDYKRPLGMGDSILVRTQVQEIGGTDVRVGFEIIRKSTGKLAADGYFVYTMINLQTNRAETIPDWIVAKYSI